jgi:hypothetical protein
VRQEPESDVGEGASASGPKEQLTLQIILRRKENAMATEKELGELIGRAVTDLDFRAQLMEDPEKAIKDAGYDITEEQLAGLKAVDLSSVSGILDERLSKSGYDFWNAD